jgi:hypothetical protein
VEGLLSLEGLLSAFVGIAERKCSLRGASVLGGEGRTSVLLCLEYCWVEIDGKACVCVVLDVVA